MLKTNITEENFDAEVINNSKPTVLYLWAEWCGPCASMSPLMAEMAEYFESDADVAKINIDNNNAIASQFGVSSIPCVIIIKNGEPVAQHIGATDKNSLVNIIKNNI